MVSKKIQTYITSTVKSISNVSGLTGTHEAAYDVVACGLRTTTSVVHSTFVEIYVITRAMKS